MKLTDLDASFIQRLENGNHRHVETIAEAQGIVFQCPECAKKAERSPDGGYIGVHYLVLFFSNPMTPPSWAQAVHGHSGWEARGGTIAELDLSPSIGIGAGNSHAHFHIKAGAITP